MRYVYLVRTTQLLKIGYSKKLSLSQQVFRYKTYYPTFNISAFMHNEPKQFESYLKWKLNSYSISGELFYDNAYDEAVQICEENCDLIFQKEILPINEFHI